MGGRKLIDAFGAVALVAVVALILTGGASAQTEPNSPTAPSEPSGRTPRRYPEGRSAPDQPATTTEETTQSGSTTTRSGSTETSTRHTGGSGVSSSKVLSHVKTDEKVIALTLDDGYHPDPRILDFIAANHLHGTAFIVGAVADANPEFVRRVADLGWMVCSHTYNHKVLPGMSDYQIRREIVRGVEAVERVVGYRCPYFRAPYGAVNYTVASVTDSLGLKLIGWESSLSDSAPKGTDPAVQVAIAFQYLRPGSVLLGHFGATNSYRVLRMVVKRLVDDGYRIGSVSELLNGEAPSPGPVVLSDVAVGQLRSDTTFGGAARNARHWQDFVTTRNLGLFVLAVLLALFFARRRQIRRRRLLKRAQHELRKYDETADRHESHEPSLNGSSDGSPAPFRGDLLEAGRSPRSEPNYLPLEGFTDTMPLQQQRLLDALAALPYDAEWDPIEASDTQRPADLDPGELVVGADTAEQHPSDRG